jgi:hypothetical protein
VEMQEWNKENKGYRYMLNVIDVFSKYAWSVKLLDKTATAVLTAFKNITETSNRKPKHIWVDQGKEFYNKQMDQWLKENDIIRYSTFGEHKSAVVERFNRTLKEKMWKKFTANNTRNWIDMLDDLLLQYNNTKHSSTKLTPTQASNTSKKELLNNFECNSGTPKFKIHDKVRISRIKGIFEKGYLPNWSEEIFEIVRIKSTIPFTYVLKDTNDEELAGSFYEEELQKTNQEVFRIEKIIRKKTIKGIVHGLVKWVGYSHKFNEWKPMSEISNIS